MSFNKYNAKIVSSPYVDKIQDGMCIEDINFGFGNGNYDSYIQIVDTYQEPISIRLLLTWNQVLNGCVSGIQVWRQGLTYRDVSSNFHNARRNPENMKMLLSKLYEEIYGDRLQLFHIVCVYYRISLTQSKLFEAEYFNFLKIYEPTVLSTSTLPKLLSSIDKAFGDAIQDCYFSFQCLGTSIVDDATITKLYKMYKKTCPKQYDSMKKILGFDKKEGLTRNMHLAKAGYYDNILFNQFMSQARVVNNHVLVNWAIINSGAIYSQGGCKSLMHRATNSGIPITM